VLEQYRGAVTAFDEGLVTSDPVLAAAVWRNLFGAGWGSVAGVKGKRAPKAGEEPVLGPDVRATGSVFETDAIQDRNKGKKTVFTNNEPIRDPGVPLSGAGAGGAGGEGKGREGWEEVEFVEHLERLVQFMRRETVRLERLSDDEVVHGLERMKGKGLVDFTAI